MSWKKELKRSIYFSAKSFEIYPEFFHNASHELSHRRPYEKAHFENMIFSFLHEAKLIWNSSVINLLSCHHLVILWCSGLQMMSEFYM